MNHFSNKGLTDDGLTLRAAGPEGATTVAEWMATQHGRGLSDFVVYTPGGAGWLCAY